MSSIKRLFRNTLVYAVAPQLSKILNLLILPFITSHLTATDYGIYALLAAYIGVIEGLKDLGFSLLITNAYFKQPLRYKQIWQRIYGFNFIWGIILFFLATPLVYFTIPEQDRVMNEFLILAVTALLPTAIYSSVNIFGICYFQYQERPMPIAIVSVVTGLISAIGTYFFAVELGCGYKSFIYSSFIAATVAFIFYQIVIRSLVGIKLKFEFTYKWVVRKLKKTVPTIPHFYTNYVLSISDRLILRFYEIPLSQIGAYGFAYNLANNYSMLGKAVAKASGPFYMRSYKSGDTTIILKVTAILQLIFLTGAVVLCLWMKEIFGVLANNKELSDSYYLAIPVIMANAVYPLYFASISLLRYKGITFVFWKITAVACIINVGLNLILIPFFGIEAAALVTLVSHLYMGFSGFAIKEFRDLNNVDYHEVRWLTAMLATSMIALLLRDSDFEIKSVVTLIIIFISALLGQKFRRIGL